MAVEGKSCVLTGAHGFVGSRLKGHLERGGWRVTAWTRQPEPGTGAVAFRLGQEIDPNLLKGAQALVHCAYDFGPRRWEDIAAIKERMKTDSALQKNFNGLKAWADKVITEPLGVPGPGPPAVTIRNNG